MYVGKRINNRYCVEFKEQVVKEYFDGIGGSKFLGKKYGISPKTIEHWIEKAKKNIDLSIDNRGKGSKGKGRLKTKNLTLEDYRERYEILKKYQAFLQARRGKK